jgi:hypothetical protein
MRCADARERMLEADRNDLAGATDSDLSRHLRGCAGCRAAADRILEVERELGRALAAAAPRGAADDPVVTAPRRRAGTGPWIGRGRLRRGPSLPPTSRSRRPWVEVPRCFAPTIPM